MIRAKVCFAAVAVVRDADTNTISAFNILEGITPSGLPLFMQNVAFLIVWERDLTDPAVYQGTFTIAIDADTLSTIQVTIDFEGKTRHRSIGKVNGLIVPKSGVLRFKCEIADAGVVAEYAVSIDAPPAAVVVQ